MAGYRRTSDESKIFSVEETSILLKCAMALEIDVCGENSRFRVNKESSTASLREENKGCNFPIFFHIEHNIPSEYGPMFAEVIVMSRELVKVLTGIGETIILVPVLRETSLLVSWTQQLILPTTDTFMMTLARTVSDRKFIFSVSCPTDRHIANIRKDLWKSQKIIYNQTPHETLLTFFNILRANFCRLYRNHLSSSESDFKAENSVCSEADAEYHERTLEKFEKLQKLVDAKADEPDCEILSVNLRTESTETTASMGNTSVRGTVLRASRKSISRQQSTIGLFQLPVDISHFFTQNHIPTASGHKCFPRESRICRFSALCSLPRRLLSETQLARLRPFVLKFRGIKILRGSPPTDPSSEYSGGALRCNFNFADKLTGQMKLRNMRYGKHKINHGKVLLTGGSQPEINFPDVLRSRPLKFELGYEESGSAPKNNGCLFGQDVADAEFGMFTSAATSAKMNMTKKKKPKYQRKALVHLDSVLKACGQPVFLTIPLMTSHGQLHCMQRFAVSEYAGISKKDVNAASRPDILLSMSLQYINLQPNPVSTKGGNISRIIVIIPGKCLGRNSGSCCENPTQYAINTAIRIIKEVNIENGSLDVSNSLEDVSAEPRSPPRTPKVTGFILCDTSGRHILFIETAESRLARKLTFIFCELASQYTRNRVKQAPRILYNTTLKFTSHLYTKLHQLCLRAPLHEFVQRDLLYIRDLVPEPAFQALTRLYALSEHCFSFSLALRLDLLPDPAGIQAICQHFCLWTTDS